MQYTEIDIKLDEVVPFSEIIIAKLDLLNFETFHEYDSGIKCYIKSDLLDMKKLKFVLSDLSQQTNLEYSSSVMPDKNWNEEWEKNFNPIEINSKCYIRSSFHKPNNNFEDEIIITPKMSFGTGHHETTFLMINEMYNLTFDNKSVLDVGCGTGILSILSSMKNAKKIIGIDIDNWAYQNSIENSKLNSIENIDFIEGEIDLVDKGHVFDIILANINRNIILKDIHKYYNFLKKNGELLISGFLKDDIEIIYETASKLGLCLITKKKKGKWYMMHLRS